MFNVSSVPLGNYPKLPLPTMEGLFADVVLTADVKAGLSSVCLPQEADSFFGGVAFAFHFLGPFNKVPDYHSRWISLMRLNHHGECRNICAIFSEIRVITFIVRLTFWVAAPLGTGTYS